ncbi:MAG: sulfite oxidase-like oxidoreductase [Chloroflexi bacterium]|nr:sulfite oxidase-like oxidoreductase [Chloroflexota bacterium]
MPDNPIDKVLRLKRANPKRPFDPKGGRLPPGQYLTEKFPVLHYGGVPRFDPKTWDLKVWGLVENPIRLTWNEFLALPTKRVVADIHCVTRWSKLDTAWEGVPWSWVLEKVRPKPEAGYVMAHCEFGFTANVPLTELAADENALLAYQYDDKPLEPDHGYPMRLFVPHLYFWKSAKWLRGIEFMPADRPGFWEGYGYHMRGDPWTEERFS